MPSRTAKATQAKAQDSPRSETSLTSAPTPPPELRDLVKQFSRLPSLPPIVDAATLDAVHRRQIAAHTLGKEIEKRKRMILDPQLAAVAATRELFAPFESRSKEIVDECKAEIKQYNDAAQAKLAAMTERLEARVEEGELTERQVSTKVAQATTRMGIPSIPTTTRREVVVQDESKVPRKYFELNMVRVRRDALESVTTKDVGTYASTVPGVFVVVSKEVVNR